MGAVTALLYAQKSQCSKLLKAMVLDSPFASLKKLAIEQIMKKTGLPKILVLPILSFIKTKIKAKAGFKIESVEPIKNVERIKIPSYFICGSKDKLVPASHCK